MKRVYGYIRISDKKQEAGVSRQEQKSSIKRYAQNNNLTIIEWAVETYSASKSGRPLFSKIIADLKNGKADGVVMHKVDRSTRNGDDWQTLMNLYDEKNIIIGFAHSNHDLSTRAGRLAAEIEAVFAADYSRNLRDEVKKGLYGRLKQGIYPFAAPVGYLDKGKGKLKAVDPRKAPLVRQMFELYATGEYSQVALLHTMNKKGLTNIKNNPLCKNNISRMLKNPYYMGVIKIRKTGETFIGSHKPLISRTLFDRVQQRLTNKHAPKTRRHQHIFKGLLTCASCHYTMPGTLSKGRYYFRCLQKACSNTTNEHVIDLAVQHTLNTITLADSIDQSIYDVIEAEVAELLLQQKNQAKSLELQQNNLQGKLNTLTDKLIDGILSEDEYLTQKERINTQLKDVNSQHQEVTRKAHKIRDRAEEIIRLLKSAKQSYLSASIPEKRLFLKKLISNFFVDAGNPVIELRKPFKQLQMSPFISLCSQHRANTPIRTKNILTEQQLISLKKLSQTIVKVALEIDEIDLPREAP